MSKEYLVLPDVAAAMNAFVKELNHPLIESGLVGLTYHTTSPNEPRISMSVHGNNLPGKCLVVFCKTGSLQDSFESLKSEVRAWLRENDATFAPGRGLAGLIDDIANPGPVTEHLKAQVTKCVVCGGSGRRSVGNYATGTVDEWTCAACDGTGCATDEDVLNASGKIGHGSSQKAIQDAAAEEVHNI